MDILKELKKELYTLVKNDYGFELYNYSNNVIRFSFYHLNSAYNAFCTTLINVSGTPSIEWQYARENKTAANHAVKIVNLIKQYYVRYKNYDPILKEIEFYSELSRKIFDSKYSIETYLYTFN